MSTVIGITTNERYYTIIGANFPVENAASFKLGWAVHETPGIYNIVTSGDIFFSYPSSEQ